MIPVGLAAHPPYFLHSTNGRSGDEIRGCMRSGRASCAALGFGVNWPLIGGDRGEPPTRKGCNESRSPGSAFFAPAPGQKG